MPLPLEDAVVGANCFTTAVKMYLHRTRRALLAAYLHKARSSYSALILSSAASGISSDRISFHASRVASKEVLAGHLLSHGLWSVLPLQVLPDQTALSNPEVAADAVVLGFTGGRQRTAKTRAGTRVLLHAMLHALFVVLPFKTIKVWQPSSVCAFNGPRSRHVDGVWRSSSSSTSAEWEMSRELLDRRAVRILVMCSDEGSTNLAVFFYLVGAAGLSREDLSKTMVRSRRWSCISGLV